MNTPYIPELPLYRFFDPRDRSFRGPDSFLPSAFLRLEEVVRGAGAEAYQPPTAYMLNIHGLVVIPASGYLDADTCHIYHGDLIRNVRRYRGSTVETYVAFRKAQNTVFYNIVTGTPRVIPSTSTQFFRILGSALTDPTKIPNPEIRNFFDFSTPKPILP